KEERANAGVLQDNERDGIQEAAGAGRQGTPACELLKRDQAGLRRRRRGAGGLGQGWACHGNRSFRITRGRRGRGRPRVRGATPAHGASPPPPTPLTTPPLCFALERVS